MPDINEELNFLKARGYEIGESFVSPEGKMHTWVANRACTSEHVAMLVALENMKSEVTRSDSPALRELAKLCRKAAAGSETTPEVAAKARALETEWQLLVQRGTPPPPSLKEKKALDAEGEALAGRMVAFLTLELPNISVLTIAQAG